MAALPLKPEYDRTLGGLLAPRWHAAPPRVRRALIALAAGLLAAVVAAVLTLENATYAHRGMDAFSFSYRGLWRTAPDPGGYVRLVRRRADGTLRYSFAVDRLLLPSYSRPPATELALYAARYVRALGRRYQDFTLRGEGGESPGADESSAYAVPVSNTSGAYEVLYTALVEGHELFGRDILLLPQGAHPRTGVAIVMLISPADNHSFFPTEVASSGVLYRPLASFRFG